MARTAPGKIDAAVVGFIHILGGHLHHEHHADCEPSRSWRVELRAVVLVRHGLSIIPYLEI
jgi:hypothetical protein